MNSVLLIPSRMRHRVGLHLRLHGSLIITLPFRRRPGCHGYPHPLFYLHFPCHPLGVGSIVFGITHTPGLLPPLCWASLPSPHARCMLDLQTGAAGMGMDSEGDVPAWRGIVSTDGEGDKTATRRGDGSVRSSLMMV
ncbi:hypothetical protein EX30DRAFT_248889 [Ascodesmis nigricans]|uniref:Uncharacterized protein n=1 Tax=Ascodesmis nigricans TaxID=341454 RepID=A0A4S2MY74_9PEZI|nr:hypothetical protein EX30DRAFT_248889 [Ascodesmis nigricans]